MSGFDDGVVREEPSASMRTAARTMRDLFVALLHEGFTERQALTIVGYAVAAGGKGR